MNAHGIDPIDLVVVNLYAFDATVAKGSDFSTCIENIDIGGPSMLRSSAKNHAAVVVSSSPSQYPTLLASLASNGGSTPLSLRRDFAAAAYTLTASYDASISRWFAGQLGTPSASLGAVTRTYIPDTTLKYGCNPHQSPAWVGHIASPAGTTAARPFTILNGTPGYINFLDAANAWQLVNELALATGLPSAASFKHCSPAGAATAVPLTAEDALVYDLPADAPPLTPLATAYLRARQADPLCSYGDFAAVSHIVDQATALILKSEVSDGLIAPGYEPAALEILKGKKNGAFIILQAEPTYVPPPVEFREVFGMVMSQKRNDAVIKASGSLDKVVTEGGVFSEDVSKKIWGRQSLHNSSFVNTHAPHTHVRRPNVT